MRVQMLVNHGRALKGNKYQIIKSYSDYHIIRLKGRPCYVFKRYCRVVL